MFTLGLRRASLLTRCHAPELSASPQTWDFKQKLDRIPKGRLSSVVFLRCIICDYPQVIYIWHLVEISRFFRAVWDGGLSTPLTSSPPSSSRYGLNAGAVLCWDPAPPRAISFLPARERALLLSSRSRCNVTTKRVSSAERRPIKCNYHKKITTSSHPVTLRHHSTEFSSDILATETTKLDLKKQINTQLFRLKS